MTGSLRKAAIRREILSRRRDFAGSAEERSASLRAQCLLLEAFPGGIGRKAGLYVPLWGEVDTDGFCRGWLDAGGSVYYPRAVADGGLAFYPRPDEAHVWIRGPHGVPEPPAVAGTEESRFDLLVVPGVAFDARGMRLGRGAGCYDRFLSTIPRPGALVGLAWSWQLLEDELPVDRWDVPVDAVVTEKGVVRAGQRPSGTPPHST